MPLYAHAMLELSDGSRVERGEIVPSDLESLEHYIEGGAVSEEPYDPDTDKSAPPDVIVIDGISYHKAVSTDA